MVYESPTEVLLVDHRNRALMITLNRPEAGYKADKARFQRINKIRWLRIVEDIGWELLAAVCSGVAFELSG